MAYQRQDEPLVSDFQPVSSAYGITVAELTELNEVSNSPVTCHTYITQGCSHKSGMCRTRIEASSRLLVEFKV